MGSNSKTMMAEIAHDGLPLETFHKVFAAWLHRDPIMDRNMWEISHCLAGALYCFTWSSVQVLSFASASFKWHG